MEKVTKYKVINPDNKAFGKKIKALPDDMGVLVDVKTGERYSINELREIPDKHAAYFGIHIFHFGIFLFAREYVKYHSYQFGVSFDFINSIDKYFDIELRFICFGIGIRFVWTKQV